MPIMRTNCSQRVIKIKKGPLNFKSRSFLKGLARVKRQNEKIDRYSKIDTKAMFDRFDI